MNEVTIVSVLIGAVIGMLFVRLSSLERRLNRLSRLEAKLDALLAKDGIQFDAFHGVPQDVREALEQGQTILAVRRLREAGLGLKEAKEYIDEVRRRKPVAY